jgi:hypothetical protein
MSIFINWFTKKRVLVISLMGAVVQLIARNSLNFGLCADYHGKCGELSTLVIGYSFIFIAILIFFNYIV